MRFFITYSQPSVEKKALSLSKKLNLELFDDSGIYDTDSFSSDYFLVCKSERLILKKGLSLHRCSYPCLFSHPYLHL